MYVTTAPCMVCGKQSTVEVDYVGYHQWLAGELIQRALPTLSADDRELLITGTCSPCFEAMFAEEER